MAKTSGLKPGQIVPRSGQYQQTGPRGGRDPEVTSVKGEPLPPAPTRGSAYTLVDPTKHQSGRLRWMGLARRWHTGART